MLKLEKNGAKNQFNFSSFVAGIENVSVLRNESGWETKILRWKNSGVSRILHGMQSEQQGGDTVGAVSRPANLVDGRMCRRMGASLDVKRQAAAQFCLAAWRGAKVIMMYDDLIMMPRKLPVASRAAWITGSHPPINGLSATLTT